MINNKPLLHLTSHLSLSFSFQGNRVSTSGDSQTIKIGRNPLSDIKKQINEHADNRIKSTKYTLITFLPKNMLEQFRRIANFYFLVMTTIAIIIGK